MPGPQVDSRDERRTRARAARAAALVQPTYPVELPVAAHREAIQAAIRANQVVVVQADTGSGKTTQLPKMLLELGYGVEGEIAHTQPRRLAARATAQRVASELGVPLGTVVGCQVRFDDRSDQTTRLRVLTDGVLLAQLAHDRLLRRYDAIVIDEVHERSLNVDFLLGSLRRILPRRPELRVVLASATMEADRLAAAFGGAPVLDIPGRLFPVEVRWRPPAEGEPGDASVVADAVEACLQEGPGDVLVFLPGEREILEAVETLRGRASCREVDVLPLFGRLGDAEQDRAISVGARRRVTVATNVAETSLTVPGVRWVVDAGLVRLSRWSSKSRVQRLLVEPAAKASLEQRKGRAGRVAAGVCVRLMDEADFAVRTDAVPPEILRSNLAGVVLRMKDLGLGDPAEFPFIDPPGERRLQEAEETLREIGATGPRGELTRLGRQMARLPVDPRVARVLLEGVRLECGGAALTLAAWLSAVDPRERPPEKAQEADLAHQPFRDGEGDLIGALRLWQAWEEAQRTLGSSALKRWCRERHLSHRRLREWTDVRRQLDRLLRERLEIDPGPEPSAWRAASVHRAVLAGYASHVALRGRDGLYRLADGSTFSLHPRSGMARGQPPWVVAMEVVDTGRRQARVVARIQPGWVERAAPHLIRRTLSEPHWVRETGQVAAWERVSMGQLDLIERRRVPYGPVHPAEARVVFIRSALVEEQLGIEAPFLQANRRMRDEAEAWAQARRRSDLLADAEAAYAFYDARVPATVHSRPDFERWRKQAELRQPGLLQMQRTDLVTDVADDEAFPRRLVMPAGEFPVAYRHAPGHEEDGLTLTVPLVSLGDLDAGQLEWSVPGRRVELVQALIRSLPKRVRVRFQPVEDFSEGFLQAHRPSDGPIRVLLARHLSAASGLEVAAADFEMKAVAEHLSPRVRILDGERVRAEGRDLDRLRDELAGDLAAARQALMHGFEQGRWCGMRQEGWPTFAATLPVPLEVPHAMGVMRVWGTLTDTPDGVETAWTGTEREATTLLEAASLRWMHARLRSQVQHHLDFDPAFQPLQWSSRGLGSPAGLVHVAAVRSVQIACVGEGAWPRSESELEACIDRGGAGLLAASQAVLRVMETASRVAERVRHELGRPSPADWMDLIERTRTEVNWLLGPEGFERSSPRLFHRLPDLLQACVDRVQRLGGGGATAVRQSLEGLQLWQDRACSQGPPGVAGRQFREMVLEVGLGLHARGGGPWPRVRDLERAWMAIGVPPVGSSAAP